MFMLPWTSLATLGQVGGAILAFHGATRPTKIRVAPTGLGASIRGTF
jgi:hypothetical protein